MTFELPSCEIPDCLDTAARIVPIETGTSFLSLALCDKHHRAYLRSGWSQGERGDQKPTEEKVS